MADLLTQSRQELKEFIAHMEDKVSMGKIDPDDLSIIATNAMQLASQNTGISKDEKAKAQEYYFLILLALQDMQERMAQLNAELDRLLERQQELVEKYNDMAEWLDRIDDLIGPDGEYNRDKAIDLIKEATGKTPDPNMSNTDIQALLKLVESDLRNNVNIIEHDLEGIAGDIKDKRDELDLLERETKEYQSVLNDPAVSVEALARLSSNTKNWILSENRLSTGNNGLSLDENVNTQVDNGEYTSKFTVDGLSF